MLVHLLIVQILDFVLIHEGDYAGLPFCLFRYKTKIPIWVHFGGPYLEWKMLIYFMAIWNILRTLLIFYYHFGTFSVHLVHYIRFCTKKNLATLR
jgi:cellulose synthase/poly-beta-1,6-N-acetylglucosamine synthase-like glycosyltransferase